MIISMWSIFLWDDDDEDFDEDEDFNENGDDEHLKNSPKLLERELALELSCCF